MNKLRAIAALFAANLLMIGMAAGDAGPDIFAHAAGIWQIQGTARQERWLIIHNLEEARATGLFHIEIIGRDDGRPAWAVVHIRDHMAIDLPALRRSVIRPLNSGGVYPESFDGAFARWKKEADRGRAAVCTTTVADCLKN